MEMKKANWTQRENSVSVTVPVSKIDEENRRVIGFATLDNEDRQGDVVTAEASAAAFSRFRGNVREMHQPIAVGKVVDFFEDSYYDPTTEKFYSGIAVSVYVSTGAKDTWEKVLDGTLSGFSIKGNVNQAEPVFVKDDRGERTVQFIKDYDLTELSLVDSPCNQLANILTVHKVDGDTSVTGMAAELDIKNVFWCGTDSIAKTGKDESASCNYCGDGMEKIGWIESDSNDQGGVKEVVTKFLDSKTEKDEGRIEKMTEQKAEDTPDAQGVITSETVKPKAEEEPKPAEEDGGEVKPDEVAPEGQNVGEASLPQEVEEPDFTKMFDELRDSVHENLKKGADVTKAAIKAVEDKIAEVEKSFEAKTGEVLEKYDDLNTKLEEAKKNSDDVEKRLVELQNGTAIKKSSDVGSGESTLSKRDEEFSWSGSFIGADTL